MVKENVDLVLYFIIDLIKLGLIMWGILEYELIRRKQKYFLAGSLALLSIIASNLFFEKNRSLVEVFVTIILLLTICYLFQGKLLKKLASSLLVYVCVIFFDMCVAGSMSLLLDLSFDDIVHHDILINIGNSFSIIIISIIILIKKRRRIFIRRKGVTKKIYALLFTGAVTGVFFISGLMLTNLQGAEDSKRRIILVAIMIASSAYFAACLMIVMISESRDSYKILSQINQTVIEAQQKYYILANEKEQEIRSIRHDIKNHLYCINGLCKGNKLEELNQYINQLIDQTDSLDELFDSGNDIVNAILNDAHSRYHNEGIRISLEGTFPKELTLAPMDLCVIFANAVSNAVEAIQKIERKKDEMKVINIKISSFKEDLFIDFWNPIAQKVEVLDGKLKTTKQDKKLHGFGTTNMIQKVKKYHGSINFESKEYMFYVHIHMKNEE